MRLLRALLSTCWVIPACAQQHPLPNPTTGKPTVTPALFDSLSELARIVDVAYCVSTTGIQSPFECLSWCTTFPHFNLIETFNTGPLLADTAGYLAYGHSPEDPRIILAFRGTYNIANTVTDLSTIPQKYIPYIPPDNETTASADDHIYSDCPDCTVHAGFLSSWQSTRDTILPSLLDAATTHPNYTIHLVGHSLGGAVSLLAALDLRARGFTPVVTTFGEPRVGNDAFVNYLGGIHWEDTYRRVTHTADPVPLLPPLGMGYRSHGHELFIGKKDLPIDAEDVVVCEGNEDDECSAPGEDAWLWELFFAHRDYFTRLGLCMKKEGNPWDGWLGGGEDEL